MKIGLLAMSGIRACDAKLLALGLTLPGVVDRSRVVAQLPSLGLLYLAAATPAEHEVHYFEAEADGNEPAELYDCDLVAINTFTAQVRDAYRIADRLRARGVRVAMGGLHVTVRPEEAAEHGDYICVGEGEAMWAEVVRAAAGHSRRQFWKAADFPPVDIHQLPTPRFDLLADRRYNRFTVQTTRGCPWRCDFCASNVMLQQAYRKRPVEQVIRDVEELAHVRRRPFLEFADDNTFVDKAWGKELCRQLAPFRLPWFTETDVSVADDDELLYLMRKARCQQVLIGLESPEQSGLNGMELRADFKAKRWSSYRAAINRIQAHGITVNGCFILGLDSHTPSSFQEIADFVDDASLFEVQITVLTPFPGTPLYDRFKQENRLLEPEAWERCTLFDVNFRPKQMSPDELREGLYWLTQRLYGPAAVARRRCRFLEGRHRYLNMDE